MKRGNLIAIIVGVVLLVFVITSAILINKHQSVDNGFIATTTGDVVMWDPISLPVTMYIDESADEWLDEIRVAVVDWNDAVGSTLLRTTPNHDLDRNACSSKGEPSDPAVFISETDNLSLDEGGHAFLHWDSTNRIRCVDLVLSRSVMKELRHKVVMHELGHTLGLAHDGIEDSVMYPGGLAIRWGLNQITKHDADLLRDSYGRVNNQLIMP